MEGDIKKGSLFISHFEAIRKIPDPAEQAAMYEAIFCYQFYGTMPENLPPTADLLMTGIFPVIEKEAASKNGGRREEISAEAVAAKVKELGSKKAAAEFFGVTERTVYNKLSEIEKTDIEISDEISCKFHEIEKNERRMKNEEGVNEERKKDEQVDKQVERGGEQSPPTLLENQFHSQNSVRFPAEAVSSQETVCKHKTTHFKPPTVEEVAEYCKERGNSIDAESFVAFYSSKGWMVGKNKMRDWKQAVITWEKRARAQGYQARGSPSGAAASCDRAWNANRQIF